MKRFFLLSVSSAAIVLLFCYASCGDVQAAESDSGVKKASVIVKTDADGHSVEQSNYIERVKRDNEVGAVKHLYIISSYTGDVLEYSTVKGKVTSGGKRLSPTSVHGSTYQESGTNPNWVTLAGVDKITDEVPDEYGMYGASSQYFYWFDAQGNYHQYYPSGGTFVHISDRPLRILKPSLSVTLEPVEKEK